MCDYIQLLKKSERRGSLLGLLLLILASLWTTPIWAADEPVGTAEMVVGTVYVERGGSRELARAGDPVYLQDRWETMKRSELEIAFLDNSRISVAASTTLEITEYLYKPAEKSRQSLISLIAGKARFFVQELQDFKERRFRVQTQTAIVGTRDTQFLVWAKSKTVTEALCIENAIILLNRRFPDRPVILTENMVSRVSGQKLPTQPKMATPGEREQLLKGTREPAFHRTTTPGQGSRRHEGDPAAGTQTPPSGYADTTVVTTVGEETDEGGSKKPFRFISLPTTSSTTTFLSTTTSWITSSTTTSTTTVRPTTTPTSKPTSSSTTTGKTSITTTTVKPTTIKPTTTPTSLPEPPPPPPSSSVLTSVLQTNPPPDPSGRGLRLAPVTSVIASTIPRNTVFSTTSIKGRQPLPGSMTTVLRPRPLPLPSLPSTSTTILLQDRLKRLPPLPSSTTSINLRNQLPSAQDSLMPRGGKQ